MNNKTQVYGVSAAGSNSIMLCSSLELAKLARDKLGESTKGDVKLTPVDTNTMLFDEGNLLVSKQDQYLIKLDGLTFVFFIPDLSSLAFELARALCEAQGGFVALHSKVCGVVLSYCEAQTLKDFIDAKWAHLKSKENDWYERFGEELKKANSEVEEAYLN